MIPHALLHTLALAMLTPTPSAAYIAPDGIHWRATWLGGGRLVVLGYPGQYPTDAQLAEEDPTRVADLHGDEREIMEVAMQRRAWAVARIRPVAVSRVVERVTMGEA